MRRSVPLTLALGFLLPALLLGQETNGSLRGRVLGSTGHGEEGVRVIVAGAQLPHDRIAFTDDDGFFLVVGLPDGKYSVRLSRIGIRTVSVEDVRVQIGRTTSVGSVTVNTEPVALEPLVVEASKSTVDPLHTTVGANLDPTDYALLPTERDYRSLLSILPHASASFRGDEVNVAGSTGLENQYFIDGVNVTAPWNGIADTSLPYNFVRAVEVKEGGFEAQYGKAMGAVVNAVTWTGTNELEGEAFAFTAPGALSATPKPTPGMHATDPLSYDVGGRVSGPLVRDRLWYSAAFDAHVERVSKEIVGLGTYTQRGSSERFAGKLTWAAVPDASIELSVFGDPTRQHLIAPKRSDLAGLEAVNADPFLSLRTRGGTTGVLRAEVSPSPRVLLEGTVAYSSGHESIDAETVIGREQPLYWDAVGGSVGGGFGGHVLTDQTRGTARLRATWSPERHTVVGGAEYEDGGVRGDGRTDGVVRYPQFYYRLTEGGAGRVHNRVPTLYLQDAWRITDGLTVSGGLRWSGQFITGASGNVVQKSPDEWQPRLGFSWVLGSDERQRVFGSFGRFYQQSALFMASVFYLDWMCIEGFFFDDPRAGDAEPFRRLDTSRTEDGVAASVPDGEPENLDEFTLGYERTLGAGTRVTVRAIRRDLRSSFGFARTAEGDFVIGTPGKGTLDFLPSPKREYTALEVSAEGASDRLRYRASYVLSRTWGNYPGFFAADQGEAVPGQPLSLFRPWQAENTTGPLPQDRTHVLKLSGSYATEFGLTAGAFVTVASGTPLNEFGASANPPVPARVPVFLVPRGSQGRTPWIWDVSLRATYALPLGVSRTRLILDLMHLGNPQRAVWLDETHYRLDVTGDVGVNDRYLQPLAYQPPAAIRVGIEIMR